MKTILATLAVAFFLSVCQTTQGASDTPEPLPNVNLEYTHGKPTYSTNETVSVIWACTDPQALMLIAGSPSEDAYFKVLYMYTRSGSCDIFPRPMGVVLKQHQFSFNGAFGKGEAWTIEMLDDSDAFVLVVPKSGQEV